MDKHDITTGSINEQASRPEVERLAELQMRIKALLQSQPFAVLCTQGSGHPYGSVVAYAMNQPLLTAVFATAKATRKYRLLSECSSVALVVDSRSAHADSLMQAEAITATGQANELGLHERVAWGKLLTDRHPQLKSFVEDPSTALFKVTVSRYRFVSRFQETQTLDMAELVSADGVS